MSESKFEISKSLSPSINNNDDINPNSEDNKHNFTFTNENNNFDAETLKNSTVNDMINNNLHFDCLENQNTNTIQLLPSRVNTDTSDVLNPNKMCLATKSYNFKEINLNFSYSEKYRNLSKDVDSNNNIDNLESFKSDVIINIQDNHNTNDIKSNTIQNLNEVNNFEFDDQINLLEFKENEIGKLKLQLETALKITSEQKSREEKLLSIINRFKQKEEKFLNEVEYYKKKSTDLEMFISNLTDKNNEILINLYKEKDSLNRNLVYHRGMLHSVFIFFRNNREKLYKEFNEDVIYSTHDYSVDMLEKDLNILDKFINSHSLRVLDINKAGEKLNKNNEQLIINNIVKSAELRYSKDELENVNEFKELNRQTHIIKRIDNLDSYLKNSNFNRSLYNSTWQDEYKTIEGRLNKLEKELEFKKNGHINQNENIYNTNRNRIKYYKCNESESYNHTKTKESIIKNTYSKEKKIETIKKSKNF